MGTRTPTNTNTAGNITRTEVMHPLIAAITEVLKVFPYGPHQTPEQNRALASLSAAALVAGDCLTLDEIADTLREHTEQIEALQLFQSNEEQQGHTQRINELRDEIERLSQRLEG